MVPELLYYAKCYANWLAAVGLPNVLRLRETEVTAVRLLLLYVRINRSRLKTQSRGTPTMSM